MSHSPATDPSSEGAIKVIGAVLDTTELKMWKEDGTTISIPQGAPNLKELLDTIIPEIRAKGFAWITPHSGNQNLYTAYEEKSEGLVRFFKVAKSKVLSFFGSGTKKDEHQDWREPIIVGKRPEPTPVLQEAKDKAMVEEILAHAVPANDIRFDPSKLAQGNSSETVIAVVEDQKGQKAIVPGVEKLAGQIQHAVKTGSTKGVDAFLKRMAAMAKERNHTAQELLHFLERGDLPLTDSGDIVIYKRLYSRENGRFVDPHTRRVSQAVGSLVRMDPKLVDPSRHTECSQGIHVGRRGYMGSFSGDSILLGLVRPEDVIAVPYSEPDKMRVCSYHLLGKLDEASFNVICRNQPFPAGSNGQKLLAMAMSGDFPPYHEIVEIGGPNGTNVTIAPVVRGDATKAQPKAPKQAESIDLNAKPEEALKAPPVDVLAVTKMVEAVIAAPPPPTRAQRAEALWKAFQKAKKADKPGAAQELMDFKKKTKIGWTALGIPEAGEEIEAYLKK